MNDGTQSVLERAFELARSGRFTKVADIKQALSAEGFSMAQFTGATLNRQLRAVMAKGKAEDDPRPT